MSNIQKLLVAIGAFIPLDTSFMTIFSSPFAIAAKANHVFKKNQEVKIRKSIPCD